MDRHFKYATIALLVLVTVAGYFYLDIYGNPFKRPVGSKVDPMEAMLKQVGEQVKDENWAAALESLTDAAEYMRRIRFRMQIVSDKDELNDFERELEQLRALIKMEEQEQAYMIAVGLRQRWGELARP